MTGSMSATDLVAALKAAAEPTRLRILMLLAGGELNVKDMTQILGQSQPRISRHLKLLTEAGLVDRFREGSWVYFNISDRTDGGRLGLSLVATARGDDAATRRDRERAEALKRDRERAAQAYFREHAADWDRIRKLHVAESAVEEAMGRALGPGPFRLFVDLGTGTGRTLELFAERYERGLGIDVNHTMLSLARANLARSSLAHAQVRHGDLYNLGLPDASADAVVMHQVLHYLSEPAAAISEAARVLAPGAKLLIVDFAPHEQEFLRDAHAHERLGFGSGQIGKWCAEAGLAVRTTEELQPTTSAPDQLTVMVWLAERPSDARHADPNLRHENLEEMR